MKKFDVGNVIKSPYGDVIIVTKINDTYVDWIPIGSTNCYGTSKLADHVESRPCFCLEGNMGEYDEDCEDCKGTGSYKINVVGYDKSKVLARNVKEYIINSLTKNFEW